MGEKDMVEKVLEEYNDVFADIVNVLLFNGKRLMLEDELTDAEPRSIYKADGKLHEQVSMFRSDFRIVADYFVQKRKSKDYVPDKGTIQHVHEVLQLMSVLTGDNRYEDAVNEFQKGERVSMDGILDKYISKGIEKGKWQTLFELVRDGLLSIPAAAQRSKLTDAEFLERLKKEGYTLDV